MKTEQDIRKFMQENRIPVPKDSAFMDDLLRQINSLPVPASLSGTEDKVQENIRMVKTVLEEAEQEAGCDCGSGQRCGFCSDMYSRMYLPGTDPSELYLDWGCKLGRNSVRHEQDGTRIS